MNVSIIRILKPNSWKSVSVDVSLIAAVIAMATLYSIDSRFL